MARTKTPKDENETRNQLMSATLDLIATKGIDKVTARSVAHRAKANQAMIFYYFGSVNNLIIQSVVDLNNCRYEVYKKELEKATNVSELIESFVDIFGTDRKASSFQILSQFVSNAKSNKEIADAVAPVVDKWLGLTTQTIEHVVPTLPKGVQGKDIALVVLSMLLGAQFIAMIPQYEQEVNEVTAKIEGARDMFNLIPVLLGSLNK